MKYLILLLTCFVFNLQSMAMTPKWPLLGTISGQIVDAKTNTPLPYVNIIVMDDTGNIVSSGITTDNGTFSLKDLPKGSFNMTIQFIGYKTLKQNITVEKNRTQLNLGIIKLEEELTALNEVTIVADNTTIQQKVDRKVITIGKKTTNCNELNSILHLFF